MKQSDLNLRQFISLKNIDFLSFWLFTRMKKCNKASNEDANIL